MSPEAEKVRIEAEVHRLVTARDKKYTNFIEYNSYKLIYRRYAGLFFTIAVDTYDNELSYLETIHLFVELLDYSIVAVVTRRWRTGRNDRPSDYRERGG